MSKAWFHQKERSNAFWIFIVRGIALHLGRPAARLLLYPIALYFLLFSIRARQASANYLRRIFQRQPRWTEQLKHFHCFAATILDRVFLLSGQQHRLNIQIHNAHTPLENTKPDQGCILLGSHLGSFEVLRTLAFKQKNLPVKILMYSDHNATLTRMLNVLNPEISNTVIPLGKADTLLKAKEYLDQGYSIGILGDRIGESDKQVECDFLGSPAYFPAGPLRLAATLNVPVVLFYGLYNGGRRYDVHFELLSEAPNVAGDERPAFIHSLTCRYAQRLAHYARQRPYNWFNFYEYWGKE